MISTRSIRHLPSGTGRTFSVLGDSITFKGEPDDDTPDAPLLFEHMLPATLGVPPHTERNHEAFYVLDGTLVVESEGERYRLGAGDFLSIPPGVPHALHNPGPGPARVLTLVSAVSTSDSSPPSAGRSKTRTLHRRPTPRPTSRACSPSAANAESSSSRRRRPDSYLIPDSCVLMPATQRG